MSEAGLRLSLSADVERDGTGPSVDVVVSTRDRAVRLGALLDALRAQELAREAFTVTVVDNGSHDATPAVLAQAGLDGRLDLRVVRRARGDGPAHGRDAGWRAGGAPLVAFTDDDCRPEPRWLAALVEAARARPATLLAGRTDPDPAELHRLAPTARTQTVLQAGPWFPTCNIAYPRTLLERLGGFDLRYGWGGEDTDLAWRAQAAGAPVAYVEGARVLHAVEDLGALGALRLAGRWSEAMRVFAAHPALRRQALYHGVFWRRAHRDLLLGAAGLALAPRLPLALALALPWLHGARRRLWLSNGSARHLPLLMAVDAVEVAAVVRGGCATAWRWSEAGLADSRTASGERRVPPLHCFPQCCRSPGPLPRPAESLRSPRVIVLTAADQKQTLRGKVRIDPGGSSVR